MSGSLFQANMLFLLVDKPSAASPTRFVLLSRKDSYDRAIVRAMCIGKTTPEDCATCLRIAELHIRRHWNDTREASIWYSATSGY
uniref:Gnk2-homologous domain-containing protein n=1 Tax=Leersia perrieri TaxID=77586 RepID=A0A0D9W3M8_9ORYZ